MDESTLSVRTVDNLDLHVYRWAPDGDPRGVVQIQHGLGEHAGRYKRFGEALTKAGYLVYAPDARGSGRTAQGNYGAWGEASWTGWVDDVDRLVSRVRADNPGLKLALFGHSLGSFATQQYLVEHSADVDAVILSGTTDVAGIVTTLGAGGSADLSAFNAPFEHRTGFEWLSRDEAEVDRYVADPACGFASEPFRGMESLSRAADPESLAGIRDDIPVLLISGTADPLASGGEAIHVVANRYRDAGLTAVSVELYPDARHELLNETNRDEVTQRVLTFLGSVL